MSLREQVEALLDMPDAKLLRTGHAYRKAIRDVLAIIDAKSGRKAG